MFGTQSSLMGAGLLAQALCNQGPLLGPAVRTEDIAQSQERIDIGSLPMHPRTFQTSLHHQFIGAFNTATANRPTLLLKGRILHLGNALVQIGQVVLDEGDGRMLALKDMQFGQQAGGTFMFELVQTRRYPLMTGR